MTTTYPTHTDRLTVGYKFSETAAHAFGVLVNLTVPTLEHYRSDLYHDAMQIREDFAGKATCDVRYLYVVQDSGTHLIPWDSPERDAYDTLRGTHYDVQFHTVEREITMASVTQIK